MKKTKAIMYINVGNLANDKVEPFLEKEKERFQSFEDTFDIVFLPVRDGATRFELVLI